MSDWKSEYEAFREGRPVQPPRRLTQAIHAQIFAELNPSLPRVFSKLALVHAVIGALTLLLCPQFGWGFSEHGRILHWLMEYGHAVCSFGCGAFFLGSSALVASLTLTREELRVARRTELAQYFALAALSVGVLALLGADVRFDSMSLFWLAGALLGALAMTELVGFTRRARA
jgi:hypothetical protein